MLGTWETSPNYIHVKLKNCTQLSTVASCQPPEHMNFFKFYQQTMHSHL